MGAIGFHFDIIPCVCASPQRQTYAVVCSLVVVRGVCVCLDTHGDIRTRKRGSVTLNSTLPAASFIITSQLTESATGNGENCKGRERRGGVQIAITFVLNGIFHPPSSPFLTRFIPLPFTDSLPWTIAGQKERSTVTCRCITAVMCNLEAPVVGN